MLAETFLKHVYEKMPIKLQNTLITIKGYQFKRQRYGKMYRAYLKFLMDSQWYDRDKLTDLQCAELRRFLDHAWKNVPYYQAAWKHIDISSIRRPEDLRQLPILEKQELRKNLERLRASTVTERDLIWVSTSGTTGTPLKIPFTKDDMQKRMALLDRMLIVAGYSRGQRSARFSGRTLFPRADQNKVFWRMNRALNQVFFSTYHMTPENLDLYVEQLRRFRPVLIDGYPSAIYVLAQHIIKNNLIGAVTPRVIAVTAETLHDYQREVIETAFGCKVYNQYASSEGAPFITECPRGRLHINPESGVIEFVKPGTDYPAREGEVAEIVVTSFTTTALPLVRYRIGDMAVLSDERCPCGRHQPVVSEILGRNEDIIVTPDRGYVGRLDPVFKGVPPTVIKSQILQVGARDIVVRAVPDRASFQEHHLEPVVHELKERLGNVSVKIELVDDIPNGPNGKFRAVVGLNSWEVREYLKRQAAHE